MSAPPPFPRVPHLVAGRGTSDDTVLDAGDCAALLSREVVAEEKLDGANVHLWVDGGVVGSSLRAGPDAMDRAGQAGPLRAWIAEHDGPIRSLLGGWDAAYAEWLLLRHTVAYDRLPAYLIVLDLWSARTGFASIDERDDRCLGAGLAAPPQVWRGTPRDVATLDRLLDGHNTGRSRVGSEPMEGIVVRPVDGRPPRIAKLLRRDFQAIGDQDWRGGRPKNQVVEGASWR